MIRLHRCGSAADEPGLPRLSGTYRIAGTDVQLTAFQGGWSFHPAAHRTFTPTRDWLIDNQLRTTEFPTRRAALRAYEAAAAINAPPAAQPPARLTRAGDGIYRYPGHPNIRIRRSDRGWEVTGLEGVPTAYAAGLTHASTMIADHLDVMEGRRRAAAKEVALRKARRSS